MTFEPIEHDRDDYGPDDAPARPSAGRAGALWRRFWRTLTGRRDVADRGHCDPQDEIAAELVATKDALNAAYRERAHLVALLATWYPSHIGHNDPAAPDWAVVTVELATGQACWHISANDMDLFGHVQPTPHDARSWDGHSTEEKYRRIDKLAASVAAAKGDVAMSMRAERPRAEREELRAARQAADDDVRAVARVLQVYGTTPGEPAAMTRLRARFADRIAELDARDAKPRPRRTPIQGSGYTPLQLLGVVEDDEEPTR